MTQYGLFQAVKLRVCTRILLNLVYCTVLWKASIIDNHILMSSDPGSVKQLFSVYTMHNVLPASDTPLHIQNLLNFMKTVEKINDQGNCLKLKIVFFKQTVTIHIFTHFTKIFLDLLNFFFEFLKSFLLEYPPVFFVFNPYYPPQTVILCSD